MRNPLAEPYLLGVSGGAAVGAVIAVSLGAAGRSSCRSPRSRGAILAVTVAFIVAHAAPAARRRAGAAHGGRRRRRVRQRRHHAAARERRPEHVRGALWWMMGSVGGATWAQTGGWPSYVGVGGGLLVSLGARDRLLALGEDAAAGLGLEADRATRRVFLVASLVAAATVAAAGLVGFVGLVVPHIARAARRRHASRRCILGSALHRRGARRGRRTSSARIALPPAELPLGAVTAVIGVPFFLLQLRRLR